LPYPPFKEGHGKPFPYKKRKETKMSDPIFENRSPFVSGTHRDPRSAAEVISTEIRWYGFYTDPEFGRLRPRAIRRGWVYGLVAVALLLIGLSFRIAFESHRIAVQAVADDQQATAELAQTVAQLQRSTDRCGN